MACQFKIRRFGVYCVGFGKRETLMLISTGYLDLKAIVTGRP
jgi:hypothetical protein